MTRAAKIVYLGAILIGICIGSTLGYRRGIVAFQALNDFERLAATSTLGDFSYLQYRHADAEHGRRALLMYTDLLQELEQIKPDKTNKIDLGLAYTRLALLEDTVHNPQQSQGYIAKARYWYKTASGKDYSDDQLKSMVDTLDQRLHQ